MTGSSRPYSINNPEGLYFVTFSVVFWIDVFVRESYKRIFIDSLKFCQKEKGLNVHGWVIMSNHIHLIISADRPKTNSLSDILRDLKKFTASKIIEAIQLEPESRKEWMLDKFKFAASRNSRNSTFQFWQQDNHPEELFSNKFIEQKLNYIHQNPVKEGWVEFPEHYLYSSAKDYSDQKGMIDIKFLD